MAIGSVGALDQPHEVACPRHVERVARVRDEEQRPPDPAALDAADLLADAPQSCAHHPEANQLVAAADGNEVAAVEAAVPPGAAAPAGHRGRDDTPLEQATELGTPQAERLHHLVERVGRAVITPARHGRPGSTQQRATLPAQRQETGQKDRERINHCRWCAVDGVSVWYDPPPLEPRWTRRGEVPRQAAMERSRASVGASREV
jgi:hypothetical protein